MATVEALLQRIRDLVTTLGDASACRSCQRPIVWLQHRNGKRVPYTYEGINHFADCPAAGQFRKPRTRDKRHQEQ